MNGQLTPSEIARRGALMLQVAAGELPASKAAEAMSLSPERYHQLERQAREPLCALMEALQRKPRGRPERNHRSALADGHWAEDLNDAPKDNV